MESSESPSISDRSEGGVEVSQQVGRDAPCVRCDRSLKGAAIDGACACGEKVSVSIDPMLLRFSGKRWVKSLGHGAWGSAIGLAAMMAMGLVIPVVSWHDESDLATWWSAPLAMLVLLAAAGGMLTCGGEYRRARHQPPPMPAQVGRGLSIAGVLLNLIGTIGGLVSGKVAATWLSAAAPTCLLAGMALTLGHMSRLAQRSPDGGASRLARWASITAWMALGAALAGMVVDPLLRRPGPPLLRTNFSLANPSAYTDIGVLGLASAIVGLALAGLAVAASARFARAMGRELAALRRIRSGLLRPQTSHPTVQDVAVPASGATPNDAGLVDEGD